MATAASSSNTADNNTIDKGLLNICDTTTYDRSNDPFGSENNGTAKFIGPGGSCAGAAGGSATNSGANKFDFHTIKAASNNNSRVTSFRADLPKNELVKMLCYLEGELQARDVVIAALRNERVKQLLTHLRTKPLQLTDPHSALFRDKIATGGNFVSRQSSTNVVQAEMEVRAIIEQQMESLYQMVTKQRSTQVRMVNILTESLENNQRMRQELEEEKRKHEHDTAQGDDITYGLEMERTKLKQELETERNQRKKLEKDLKKLQETLEFERGRQKQIVLLLIAERKKILMKYIEEGKRSEDLAQILSEEKQRSDSIAEGLEEESKKSLRMEADLEKQAMTFENDRKVMKLTMARDEKRIKELEGELALLKSEIDALKKQTSVSMRMQAPMPGLSKVRTISGDDVVGSAPSSVVNVAKVVQPTATVSSVPVSGPTTGIARSIPPGQSLRQAATVPHAPTDPLAASVGFSAPPAKPAPQHLVGSNAPQNTASISSPLLLLSSSSTILRPTSAAAAQAALNNSCNVSSSSPSSSSSPASAAVASGMSPSMNSTLSANNASCNTFIEQQPSATASAATVAAGVIPSNTPGIAAPTPPPPAIGARGVPPPIPPNKPVVPPKREPSISRLGSITTTNNSK